MAAQALLLGEADIILAGGAEAPLIPVVLEQFEAAEILGAHKFPQRVCRPFDVTRDGTVIGEGAGFLVLETLASARRRGVPCLARLAGWALRTEAHDRAGMDASGKSLAEMMQRALASAGLPAAAIGYINTHGTATPLNDLTEARAIQKVFQNCVPSPACSSTKPVTGHCLGASAAIEAIITIEALRQQVAPPTANCLQPDPACAINLIREHAHCQEMKAAMSIAAGFWGNQAALIFTAA
jgi:3-oxoacyl-[acyl-carrier-protein] synthase II